MKPIRPLAASCAAALVLAAVLSCERLPDDAWMKVSFLAAGEGSSLSVLNSSLGSQADDTADIKVTNWTTGSQGTGSGVGIDLYEVRVSYSGSQTFPSYQYGVSANLPAGESAGSESVTLSGIPIVPAAFKTWLSNPANFPAATASGAFTLTARATVRGRTSEGVELAVEGSLTVSFNSEEETISTPTTPDGSTSGTVGNSMGFSTGGAESDKGHQLQYRFDWGDGTTSPWSSAISLTHAWTSAGTYAVKAQARCATHTNAVSSWSDGLNVTISGTTPTETVSTPANPTGPASGVAGTTHVYSYSTGGAVSDLGHALQYRFDWGDGSTSSFADGTSASHSWVNPGVYSVKAQARCATHPSVTSAWSGALEVTITAVR